VRSVTNLCNEFRHQICHYGRIVSLNSLFRALLSCPT